MTPTSKPPVIRLEGVCVDRDGVRVLEDLSFEVQSGEFVGLIGPNGAGKTTLLRTMLGILRVSAGRIEVFGRDPAAKGAVEGIGYVPQRQVVPREFPASASDVVMMGRLRELGRLRRPRRQDHDEVERCLERVGIADLADKPVGRLSGGEQRRVLLAQALCASRKLLILDEPTIGLDLPGEQEFYSLLRRLQGELSLTVVAVSHDLLALAGEASQLICINRRMHIHGNPEDVVHSHAIREAYSCEYDFLAGELERHEHAGRRD